jgi:hypothetical protein
MIIYWDPIEILYDGEIMVALFVPDAIVSRYSIVLNFAISFDRFQVRNNFIGISHFVLGN